MHGRDAIGGLIDARGHVRTPWRPVVDAMRAIGPGEFAARAVALDRRARFEEPGSTSAQRLDPIPVPLMDHEFAVLAQDVAERAAFLGGVLDDLYGAQLHLVDRSLPTEALFASPEFLRPLARLTGFAAPRLGFYAVDLIRHPQAGFQVVRDHTDRAPGLGLALAIRRFVAEVMPELFGAVTLASQRPVIETVQDMLHGLANGGPIGLLAGADEDAADSRLLARQIGGMVLRADDVSVARGALRLRTLAGSVPVHLLVRLGSSQGIDPLEQGGRPAHGVPGLFQLLRSNGVTMLNAPGSAVLERPEFADCYAALFQHVHGRAPRLGSAGAVPTGFDADQAPIALGAAGNDTPARFDFASVTMRLFAIRIDGIWRVLPGGIGHARRADGAVLVKDIWVIDSGEPEQEAQGPAQRLIVQAPRRVATDLPSRLADDLLWLGRMVERLDAAARLLTVAVPRFADVSTLPHEAAQRALLAACLIKAKLLPDETTGPFLTARLLNAALVRHRPLAGLVDEIRRLLDHCGDRFSISMRGMVEAAIERIPAEPDVARGALAAAMQFVAAFNGVVAEDASRSGGFVFLEIGRRLERAEALADMLAILLDDAPDRLDPGLMLAVELADAQLSYNFSNAGALSPAPALALLLASVDYPRSLAFQTEALAVAFERIGGGDEAAAVRAMTATIEALTRGVASDPGASSVVSTTLRSLSEALEAVVARFDERYFAPVPASHQVAGG